MSDAKLRRQDLLRQLLVDGDLHSQEEAVAALADAGIEVNQATVSRDLDELGAVKVRGAAHRLVYRLGDAGDWAVERLAP